MRVPSIPYREPMERHEIGLDTAAIVLLGAGLATSIVVWALATAKLIDLCAGLWASRFSARFTAEI